jgi:hypothetical protein
MYLSPLFPPHLYSLTGKFYDISKDVLEKSPLADLSPEAQQVRTMLQQVLDQYKDVRPVRATPERRKRKK